MESFDEVGRDREVIFDDQDVGLVIHEYVQAGVSGPLAKAHGDDVAFFIGRVGLCV